MTLTLETMPVPLVRSEDGTIRIKGSRVTLETLLGAYIRGDSPEEIHEGFPAIDLGDIFTVIAYYFHNKAEVEQYLAAQEVASAEIEKKFAERRSPTQIALRERLKTSVTESNQQGL